MTHQNMTIPTSIQLQNRSKLFDFVLSQRPDHTEITIQFYTNYYTTNEIPETISLLESTLPRIFRHKCFNNGNLAFKKEAANTELGHLFEHILLEFLCIYKFKEGQLDFNLKGLTEWNWLQDPRGIFYISLNTTKEDTLLLQQAILQTKRLMETILQTNTSHSERLTEVHTA
jgi:hypothetical protein